MKPFCGVLLNMAAVAVIAMDTQAQLARSPVILGIEWAPTNSIIRQANGSDRFPMTWADDDFQYTAWGDGNGFQLGPRKLSLGFSRIGGPAEHFIAEDIRSPSGESSGDGKSGLKACGMLCVQGTLFLWAGNATKQGTASRLGWSKDHSRTWNWADWIFPEFGYIGWLNFGRDYAGSRDGFVYAVAHDGPTGYQPADRFILMRVPKNRILERAAYEFLVDAPKIGEPVWAKDIGARGTMFSDPGKCLRQQMTYCASLKRYLWWQQRPNREMPRDMGDTRFKGGFRILDAPEPWGPWTLVYETAEWDTGPGEMASFPTKWMSRDGRTLYLVFSGNDHFSVRKASLTIAQ